MLSTSPVSGYNNMADKSITKHILYEGVDSLRPVCAMCASRKIPVSRLLK